MKRELLDNRIHTHQMLSAIDDLIAKAEQRRAHLNYLEHLVRSGHPLPGTPEWRVDGERQYERLERTTQQVIHGSGRVDWDGIWRSN